MKLDLANFEAVIFDMDGTMIDNTPFHREAWLEFCRRHNISLTEEEYMQKISGSNNRAILNNLFGRELDQKEFEEFEQEKESLYRELYKPNLKEVPGFKLLLNDLFQKGLRIGVATTSPKENRIMAIETLNIKNFFTFIAGPEHISQGKPHPEIYLLAAEKLGVEPDKCLVFEDTPSGVASAKGAGMTVIGVLTGHNREELNLADDYIKDFTEIETS